MATSFILPHVCAFAGAAIRHRSILALATATAAALGHPDGQAPAAKSSSKGGVVVSDGGAAPATTPLNR
jgi:hypothetical protein